MTAQSDALKIERHPMSEREFNDILARSDCQESIAEIEANDKQYDRDSVSLAILVVPPEHGEENSNSDEKNDDATQKYSEKIVILTVDIAANGERKYDRLSSVPADPTRYVYDIVSNICSESEDPFAGYNWGVKNPKDDQVKKSYRHDVVVVVESEYFHSYKKYEYMTGEGGEIIVFATTEIAQKHIDEIKSEVYRLSYNESGRPNYYIIAK